MSGANVREAFLTAAARLWRERAKPSEADSKPDDAKQEKCSSCAVVLSSRGLGNISRRDNDFAFVVGSRRYECPSFVAEFLSPLVSRIHAVDDCANELRLNVDDPDDFFQEFLLLGRGKSIDVPCQKRCTFLSICRELDNRELSDILLQETRTEIKKENVVCGIRDLLAMKCDVSNEVEFVSTHFYEMTEAFEDLRSLPFPVIYDIISNPLLKIKSEDSLLNFIVEGVTQRPEYLSLLEHVRFEYVSASEFIRFFELISGRFEHLNLSIWLSLRNRFALPVSPNSPSDRVAE